MSIFDNDTCIYCGTKINPAALICDRCEFENHEKEERMKQEERAKRMRSLQIEWKKLCPEGYRGSVQDKMPQALIDLYMATATTPGSVLVTGASGCGKTSAAFVFARREHFAGRKVLFWNSSDLRQAVIAATKSATGYQKFKKSFLQADYIVFDDVGSAGATESSDEYLLNLIENVRSRMIRTFVTTQYTGVELAEKFSNLKSGAAIARRFAATSEIIKL